MEPNTERRLEFFIGATKRDLSQARLAVIEAVLSARHMPSGMELWAAGTDPLLKDIAAHLESCDVHIILMGARYGEYIRGVKKKIGFTEWEYLQSKGHRPVLTFMLDDEAFKAERKKVLKADPRERDKESDLLRFRKELKKDRFCVPFENSRAGIEKLGRQCVNAIHELINAGRVASDVGWIRASSSDATTLRRIRENSFLTRDIAQLQKFSILGTRVALEAESKARMAITFWDEMKGRIRRQKYWNLFFESGSTLAFVSDRFERSTLSDDPKEPWRIRTNNVLTLLELLLYTNVNVHRFPDSAPDPEDKYGAIFPPDWRRIHEPTPPRPRMLYTGESAAVTDMRERLRSVGPKTLFLATASGWDTTHPRRQFRGPHVGSHPNMLFKRALFTTGLPVVIFLTAAKFGNPFVVGNCYPVFGPGCLLKDALSKYPIALCIGYDRKGYFTKRPRAVSRESASRNPLAKIRKTANDLGFEFVYADREDEFGGTIIRANAPFKKLFAIS
jgi:hypothetical protein